MDINVKINIKKIKKSDFDGANKSQIIELFELVKK